MSEATQQSAGADQGDGREDRARGTRNLGEGLPDRVPGGGAASGVSTVGGAANEEGACHVSQPGSLVTAIGPEGRAGESGCGPVGEAGAAEVAALLGSWGRKVGRAGAVGTFSGVTDGPSSAPAASLCFASICLPDSPPGRGGTPEDLSPPALSRAAVRWRPGEGPGSEEERVVTCQAGAGQGHRGPGG